MLREENPEVAAGVDRLFLICQRMARGEILGLATIEKVLSAKPHTATWSMAIPKLKRKVESELGITLWSVRTVGYELMDAEGTLGAVRKRQKFAGRQLIKGIRHLDALPDSEMTPAQRARKVAAREQIRAAKARTYGNLIRQSALIVKTEGIPLRGPFGR